MWMPDAVAALTLSRTHIALMKPAYLRSVLAGTKCVECRLSLTKRVPLWTRAAWGHAVSGRDWRWASLHSDMLVRDDL